MKKTYTGESKGWFNELEAPITVDLKSGIDTPATEIIPAGTPVMIDSNGEVETIKVIGTSVQSATATGCRFEKDHTFYVGASVNGTTVSAIDTTNDDYDAVTFADSKTWVSGATYGDGLTGFNAINFNDADLSENSLNSILVKRGGLIKYDLLPKSWKGGISASTFNSNFVDGKLTVNQKGYKEYVALLSQSGTSAPVATVLQNELGEVPVFSRDGTGEYYLTTTGDVFTANKTSVTITNSEGGKTIGGYSDTTKTVYFSQNEDL